MSSPVTYFIFGIHCHQPVGNFDFVFTQNFQKAYQPFIDVLSEFPRIKTAVHFSGPVWEWIEQNQPGFITKLNRMREINQIEIIGGGWYEPILSSISRQDALNQIELMNEKLRSYFNCTPRGLWLAERAWEPQIASLLGRSDMEYTFLDDFHFFSAGIEPEQLYGYFNTEDQNHILKVFPISKMLRYKIPFSPVEEVIECLENPAFSPAHNEPVTAVLFDDGEKFGTWPGTFQHVYENKWLMKFFTALTQSNKIKCILPGEAADKFHSRGLAYLPTGSYLEMTEWVLPTEVRLKLEKFLDQTKDDPSIQGLDGLIRGGYWRNYFSKYPESNYMSKRVNFLSSDLMKIDQSASVHILKAQCNCGYWHGIFGGIYLPHLREAIFSNLLNAEQEYFQTQHKLYSVDRIDFDQDDIDEILVRTKNFSYVISPARGGSFNEISSRPLGHNFANLIARRKEAYHQLLLNASPVSQPDREDREIPTIHDINVDDFEKWKKWLEFDRGPLVMFFEILCTQPKNQELLTTENILDTRNIHLPFNISEKGEEIELAGYYRNNYVEINKKIIIDLRRDNLEINYQLSHDYKQDLFFHLVIPVFIPEPDNPDRRIIFPDDFHLPGSTGQANKNQVSVLDKIVGYDLTVNSDFNDDIIWFPIYTVNHNEGGFEKNLQGTVVVFRVKLSQYNRIKIKALFKTGDI
ncbi:MAG: alpha-amylase/4-alpha-glucanotransferase domain-containing protein [bacterium]